MSIDDTVPNIDLGDILDIQTTNTFSFMLLNQSDVMPFLPSGVFTLEISGHRITHKGYRSCQVDTNIPTVRPKFSCHSSNIPYLSHTLQSTTKAACKKRENCCFEPVEQGQT